MYHDSSSCNESENVTGVKKFTQFAQVTRLDLENLLPEHGLHAPSLQMQTVSIDECVDHHVVDVLPAVTWRQEYKNRSSGITYSLLTDRSLRNPIC